MIFFFFVLFPFGKVATFPSMLDGVAAFDDEDTGEEDCDGLANAALELDPAEELLCALLSPKDDEELLFASGEKQCWSFKKTTGFRTFFKSAC